MADLKNFNDTLLIIGDVNGLEDLTIFASTQLFDELVVVLIGPLDNM